MEFHLLPIHRGNPPIPPPTTPYIADRHYDGGPWMTYPGRMGKPSSIYTKTSFNQREFTRQARKSPWSIREFESFLQTWLYFGLIAEFAGVNSNDGPIDPSSNEMLNRIYKTVVVENGDKKFIRLDRGCLNEFIEMGKSRMSPDPEVRKAHYSHIRACLIYAALVVNATPQEFNWAVKASIATLGELFSQTITSFLERLRAPNPIPPIWFTGFLNGEAKGSMISQGWCPSDIARVESRYQAIQTLYIARLLDKSLPPRDHSRCSDKACNLYQITGKYEPNHQWEGCGCKPLVVEEKSLTKYLFNGDKFPVLRLKGDLLDLTCEIVESGSTPYIAISHVWADGLGNPDANALPRCKLHHLRGIVDSVSKKYYQNADPNAELPLIWLDTLCAPCEAGPGKTKAIEKIRLVYQSALHVLILDSGLMSYSLSDKDIPELFIRIFTSSWMRRLWTLQEGALAKSLVFQFANIAIALDEVVRAAYSMGNDMRYRAIAHDLINENLGLKAFFHLTEPLPPGQLLIRLDKSLQYRGVSVGSDEPLCIATLLSLKIEEVLAFQTREDRMRKVWQLLSEKNGGLPSQIIFLEGARLSIKGFRWAPLTLLNVEGEMHQLNTRLLRWVDKQLGELTPPIPQGLKVKYPGRLIIVKKEYGDGKPRNPWPGMTRVPEDYLQFKDLETGRWFRIISNSRTIISRVRNDEEMREWNARELFPLHEVVDTGQAVLVQNPSIVQNIAIVQNTAITEAVFGTLQDEGTKEVVFTKLLVGVQDLQAESCIYDVIKRLALQLRADEITDKHLDLYKRLFPDPYPDPELVKKVAAENKEFKESIGGLEAKMKEILSEAVEGDETFTEAVKHFWGGSFLEDFWVLIGDFFNHDIVGTNTGEREWIVD